MIGVVEVQQAFDDDFLTAIVAIPIAAGLATVRVTAEVGVFVGVLRDFIGAVTAVFKPLAGMGIATALGLAVAIVTGRRGFVLLTLALAFTFGFEIRVRFLV